MTTPAPHRRAILHDYDRTCRLENLRIAWIRLGICSAGLVVFSATASAHGTEHGVAGAVPVSIRTLVLAIVGGALLIVGARETKALGFRRETGDFRLTPETDTRNTEPWQQKPEQKQNQSMKQS